MSLWWARVVNTVKKYKNKRFPSSDGEGARIIFSRGSHIIYIRLN